MLELKMSIIVWIKVVKIIHGKEKNMKENKYRAWDTETKTMTISRSLIDWFDAYVQFEYNTESIQINRIKQFIFLQYTGFKDKYNIEIYEGDVLRAYGGEYCQGYWEQDYTIIIKDLTNDCFMLGEIEFLEIKGNIYENPELAIVKEKTKK